MSDNPKSLEELVRELPPHCQDEVRDFAEFLLTQQRRKPSGKPEFAWAGSLKDLRNQYTSVDLQHQLAQWRTEGK